MEVWYRARMGIIDIVKVAKETEKCVFLAIEGRDLLRRDTKTSEWRWYSKDKETVRKLMLDQYKQDRTAICKKLDAIDRFISKAKEA